MNKIMFLLSISLLCCNSYSMDDDSKHCLVKAKDSTIPAAVAKKDFFNAMEDLLRNEQLEEFHTQLASLNPLSSSDIHELKPHIGDFYKILFVLECSKKLFPKLFQKPKYSYLASSLALINQLQAQSNDLKGEVDAVKKEFSRFETVKLENDLSYCSYKFADKDINP